MTRELLTRFPWPFVIAIFIATNSPGLCDSRQGWRVPPADCPNLDPDPYAWSAVESSPRLLDDLRSLLPYPEKATRIAMEGVVYLRCLVNRRGRVVRMFEEKPANRVFLLPTKRALARTRFQPAKAKDDPVCCWVSVSVHFLLTGSTPVAPSEIAVVISRRR